MFSSNSFNVCPHCGKANSLNARYCSSCGKQLVTPQEVVVCHRCHKPNSPMASYCGACGAPLRIGAKTKICPKCHREVDVNANVCSCGYSFTPVQYTAPAEVPQQAEPVVQQSTAAAAATAAKPLYNNKGGRGVAFFLLIVLLLFAFLILTPYYRTGDEGVLMDDQGNPRTIRFGFLANFDNGLVYMEGMGFEGANYPLYGIELLKTVLDVFTNETLGGMLELAGVTQLQYLQELLGIGGLAIVALVVLFVFVAFVQLIVCIARLVTGKRGKHVNYFYLVLAALTTLWVLLVYFIGKFVSLESEGFLLTLRKIFVPATFGVGYVTYMLPFFFWLLFLCSIGGKARKVKEGAAA